MVEPIETSQSQPPPTALELVTLASRRWKLVQQVVGAMAHSMLVLLQAVMFWSPQAQTALVSNGIALIITILIAGPMYFALRTNQEDADSLLEHAGPLLAPDAHQHINHALNQGRIMRGSVRNLTPRVIELDGGVQQTVFIERV